MLKILLAIAIVASSIPAFPADSGRYRNPMAQCMSDCQANPSLSEKNKYNYCSEHCSH
jgi:hypothetical protein